VRKGIEIQRWKYMLRYSGMNYHAADRSGHGWLCGCFPAMRVCGTIKFCGKWGNKFKHRMKYDPDKAWWMDK
jgi:hypothetical protein